MSTKDYSAGAKPCDINASFYDVLEEDNCIITPVRDEVSAVVCCDDALLVAKETLKIVKELQTTLNNLSYDIITKLEIDGLFA